MSLREELARRIGRLHGHSDDSPDMVKLHPIFLMCADECLRQMRWAAYEWPEDAYPGDRETVAPPDYDPSKRFPDMGKDSK